MAGDENHNVDEKYDNCDGDDDDDVDDDDDGNDGDEDDNDFNFDSCVIVLLKEMYLNSFTWNATTWELCQQPNYLYHIIYLFHIFIYLFI